MWRTSEVISGCGVDKHDAECVMFVNVTSERERERQNKRVICLLFI